MPRAPLEIYSVLKQELPKTLHNRALEAGAIPLHISNGVDVNQFLQIFIPHSASPR